MQDWVQSDFNKLVPLTSMVLEFNVPEGTSIAALATDEMGYSKPTKEHRFMEKHIGPGTIQFARNQAQVKVKISGDITDSSNAHFLMGTVMNDLRAIGIIVKSEAPATADTAAFA